MKIKDWLSRWRDDKTTIQITIFWPFSEILGPYLKKNIWIKILAYFDKPSSLEVQEQLFKAGNFFR